MARAADLLTGTGPCADELNPPDTEMRRLPLFGEKTRIGGFGGLRLGEQNALRPIDFFFEEGYVHVNGSWTQPRASDAPAFRGPVKNHVAHEVPLPASLLHRLQSRCAVLMGLPADAPRQAVVNAVTKERTRRRKLARDLGDPGIFWFNYPVDPAEEKWIFVDSETGLPARSELHNDRWHRVRRWVAQHDSEHEWPEYIPYKNLRHFAAARWFHDELDEDWVVVASYLGDKLTTVMAHYVRAGADALQATISKLSEK